MDKKDWLPTFSFFLPSRETLVLNPIHTLYSLSFFLSFLFLFFFIFEAQLIKSYGSDQGAGNHRFGVQRPPTYATCPVVRGARTWVRSASVMMDTD